MDVIFIEVGGVVLPVFDRVRGVAHDLRDFPLAVGLGHRHVSAGIEDRGNQFVDLPAHVVQEAVFVAVDELETSQRFHVIDLLQSHAGFLVPAQRGIGQRGNSHRSLQGPASRVLGDFVFLKVRLVGRAFRPWKSFLLAIIEHDIVLHEGARNLGQVLPCFFIGDKLPDRAHEGNLGHHSGLFAFLRGQVVKEHLRIAGETDHRQQFPLGIASRLRPALRAEAADDGNS